MKPWFANQSLVTILFLRIFHHLKHSLPKTSASPYSSVIIMTILSEMKMNIRKYGIILTPMNRIGLRTDFICIDANNRVAVDIAPYTITFPHKKTQGHLRESLCFYIYSISTVLLVCSCKLFHNCGKVELRLNEKAGELSYGLACKNE